MKKTTTLISVLIILAALKCYAQDIKIHLNNPQPRVGQVVSLSIDVSFLDTIFNLNMDSSIQMTNSYYGFNNLNKTLTFKDTGDFLIGPFSVEINGRTYTSDSIKVNVLPALPIEEGVWVRSVKFKDADYLIIEQMIKNKPNKRKGNTMSLGGIQADKDDFAKIVEKPEDGVKIRFRSSNLQTVNDNIEMFDLKAIGFTYMMKIYVVEFDNDFTEGFELTKKYIENLPRKTNIGNIKIR